MKAFGSGARLWQVDVVLRRDGGEEAELLAVIEQLRRWLSEQPDLPGDDRVFEGVREAASYDMEPPDGSLGASCWIRADSVGAAVGLGDDLVGQACLEALGRRLPLWDVRALPLEAVIPRAGVGTALAASRPSGFADSAAGHSRAAARPRRADPGRPEGR